MLTSQKNKLAVLLLVINALCFSAYAQRSDSNQDQSRKFINPDGLSKPTGYTHVVVTGGTVYISGQVSLNEKGEVVGKGDMRAQVTRVYENLKVCLAAVGVTFEDVVKMNTFVVNLKSEDLVIVREVRKAYLSGEHPPASTLVGVTALANPDFLVEIEAIARLRPN